MGVVRIQKMIYSDTSLLWNCPSCHEVFNDLMEAEGHVCSGVSVASKGRTQPATSEDFLSFAGLCCLLTQDQAFHRNQPARFDQEVHISREQLQQEPPSLLLESLKRKTIAEEFREWKKQFV